MAVLAYRSWGLIPTDIEPSSQSTVSTHPPMMTAMAVDRGAGLIFELAPHQGEIDVRVETTALSAEGRTADIIVVYSGSADSLRILPDVSWEKVVEGMTGVFSCRLSQAGSHLKLQSRTENNLIVTAVKFGTP